jgi:hypothetical protein
MFGHSADLQLRVLALNKLCQQEPILLSAIVVYGGGAGDTVAGRSSAERQHV